MPQTLWCDSRERSQKRMGRCKVNCQTREHFEIPRGETILNNSALKISDEILSIAMVIVLVSNDHYFKFHNPGFITGKLSDIAGPFVLWRLLRGFGIFSFSHNIAALLTLSFSVLVKTSQSLADLVAEYTCGFFFSHCGFIADPQDIFAFIPFVIWAFFRARSVPKTQV